MRSPAVSRRRIATSMRSTSAPKRPSATRPAGARPRPSSRSLSANVCARLVTEKDEVKEFINLTMSSNKPVLIGRNPRLCNYLLTEFHVSGIHCKLYAVKAPTGGLLVSCQDLSRNGIMVNGDHFKRTSVILMDGDELSIPGSQTFKCLHVWKEPHEKTTLFDPTQPSQRDSNKVKLKTMNQYVVTSKSLGSGAFATVHLAIDPSNHRQVACKTICARRKKDKQQVLSEVEMLKRLRHPNINEVYDCVESDKHFVNIFLQLCTGGDLFTYITEHSLRGRLICEAETKYIMYQVFRGVKYLHDSFISHRDLKPENIFLHSPGAYPRIMIGDFGLARPNADQATFNVVGTVSYLPPEGVLALDRKELSYIGLPSDCWSAGVILYIMLTGCHPFDNERSEPSERWMDHIQESHEVENSQQPSQQYLRGEARLKAKIARGNVEFSHEWLDFPAAQELVSDLLIMDPGQRATVDEALTSDWIASQADVLEQMYRERVSMEDDASKKMPTAPAPPL